MSQHIKCDIFCTVIDNLGDAGVSWRLARQLSVEYGWQVRLFIDDPTPLALLTPDLHMVEIRKWQKNFEAVEPADVVIEAFACNLPPSYIQKMVVRRKSPVWLNLEYLSAEDWITGCHGLPSPQSGITKHFFFPGFVSGSGGLLRENNLTVPFPPAWDGPLEISLFCYDNPQLPTLLAAWRDGDRPVLCHVCDGLPRQQVEQWLGTPLPAMTTPELGNLRLAALPFLSQTDYDALLARCHLNFVRGEDSFVRAQWAERPFVWQIYPQAEGAHFAKLNAFLKRYTDNQAAHSFFHAWNGNGSLDWPTFSAALPALATHAPDWAAQIRKHGDLATNLVKFCLERL